MADKKLHELIKNPNIADDLEDDHLIEIGHQVVEEMEEDDKSRYEWKQTADKIMKLAKLTIEKKSFPWDGAANVKYPLITTSILQFASKTYPEIVKRGKVVSCAVVGQDPDGSKNDRAHRISEFMSWQLLIESPDWEEHMDRMLHVYPTIGTAFKKTYYNPLKKRPESILCLHDEIIINDHIASIEEALRISHILKQSTNTLIENMRAGLYVKIAREELETMVGNEFTDSSTDSDTISRKEFHEIVEQHRYLDLDDDGYEEPYIVTVHRKTKKVLRIVARFDPDGILYNNDDEVVRITPVNYFTAFHCLPRMDGRFHSYGLGTLLLHPNEVVNTLLNQLINAGTLATTQGGFIADGVQLKGGDMTFRLGEWKRVKALSGDLKANVVPVNFSPPSDVLYQCLELMIQATKDLASITDVSTGQQPAQNVTNGTINTLNTNSQQVFTAMQRRLYRALKEEFEKLYRLNRIYLDEHIYFATLSDQKAILRTDFDDKDLDVRPLSDPNMSSITAKMNQAQFLGQFLQLSGQNPNLQLNIPEIEKRMFESQDMPNIEQLFSKPQPPKPDPKMAAVQVQAQKHQMDAKLKAEGLDIKKQQVQIQAKQAHTQAIGAHASALANLSKAQATETQSKNDARQQHIDALKAVQDAKNDERDQQMKQHQQDVSDLDTAHDHKMQEAQLALSAFQAATGAMDNHAKTHVSIVDRHLKAKDMQNQVDLSKLPPEKSETE